MVFEKPSLRTRVSFDVAMQELGGTPSTSASPRLVSANASRSRMSPASSARYVDVIAARTYEHQTLLDLARHAEVPVINALSDEEHPCQALADLLTVLEHFGTLRGVRLAFVGDGFNVAASLAEAAALSGSVLRSRRRPATACPTPLCAWSNAWPARTAGASMSARRPRTRCAMPMSSTRMSGRAWAGGFVPGAQGGVRRIHRERRPDGLRAAGRDLHARPAGASRR